MPYPSNGFNHMFHTPAWRVKVRSLLAQFGDLFSEFGKYIAPTYYHDRCERSVPMRLYTMHKHEFAVVFAAFFATLGLCVFIGLAGPPITDTSAFNVTDLHSPKINQSTIAMLADVHSIGAMPCTVNFRGRNQKCAVMDFVQTGPFVLKSPTLSTYNQQLWLIAVFTIMNNDPDETFQKSFHVCVTIEGISDTNEHVIVLGQSHTHNRTRQLHCLGQTCDGLTILHLGFLDFSHYIITIKFFGLGSTNDRYHIEEITFHFKSYDSSFTQLEIWFRFVFLAVTFVVTCWFAHSLRRFSYHDWAIEQKWMSALLLLLLLYNDPVFPMSFLLNSWVPGMLDAMFQASFLCALLLFWLCIYHGIRQNERRFLTFYAPKLTTVGLLWIAAFTLASWQKYNELIDPTYDYKVDTENFTGFKIFFFTVGGFYVVYLSYLVIRAYTELKSMPYFDIRLKFLTSLMLIVLSLSIVITVLRFGISVLEDNFVAELSTTYNSSVEFMVFYGLLNLYLYTMAYVYSPARNAFLESRVKDNPTLSMINDSDEEVIYGSDGEDRPLTVRRGPEDDDSD